MKSINERPDERSIYIWNIVGSMANALLSVVVLMVVTRILSEGEADIFSIAWSISQLMATIATFQIRTFQATDVTEKFKFQQYLIFRVLTVFLMLVVSVVYIFANGYDPYKGSIIFITCLFRAVEAFSDVFEGYFQQKERLDLVGKATTVRIVTAISGFAIILKLSHDLMASCIALLLIYVVCFFVYDLRYCFIVQCLKIKKGFDKGIRFLGQLVFGVAPIFFNSFLMMSISNTPKMTIDTAIRDGYMDAGTQTIFNILFLPASVLTLAYIVFRPLLTRLAILWSERKIKIFLNVLLKMFVSLLVMGVLVLLGSSFLGIPVLSAIYAIDLTEYKTSLLIIILGGCFCTFSYILDNALVVIRRQYMLVLSYVITWVYIKIVADFMLKSWGMDGASLAYATSMIVFFFVTLMIFIVCLLKTRDK